MTRTRPRIRTLLAATALVSAAVALTACVPEPDDTATPSTSATASPTASAPASASPDPATPDEDRPQATEIALPASCDDVYSTGMRGTLEAQLPPLNDPGVTLSSTQLAPALGLLESGVPTQRCTWGAASEAGLSTNVTVLAVDDVPRLQDLLAMNGYACTDATGGILCTTETESHFLRGNGWVATSWVGAIPDGYTEDIAATLWG